MEDLYSYIDGDFYLEQGRRIIPNINPATGDIISNINVPSTSCLDAAVDSAIVGQQIWK
ncbi:MAG: hypothetical protein HOI53_01060 [Francisellaceae bacterium]|jgi:hypothetical protein|nr:hypothetical protein [Francisellaceae bacterium]MBT6206590.1 hypothetical protein [Francisellaceae bacterium]MBT6539630.1 hypothetical protein [Francisellaceae bacterium]